MLWKINIVIRIYKNFRKPLLPFSLLLRWNFMLSKQKQQSNKPFTTNYFFQFLPFFDISFQRYQTKGMILNAKYNQ